MSWRVIALSVHDCALNMAIDEAVQESVALGGPPTIRFYRWKPSAVSIGYFQCLHDEVDVEKCKANGIGIVRRRTGGGAVFHDYEGEITYSVIAPASFYSDDISKSYVQICSMIVAGLKRIGIEAAFHPINDILVGHQKISGNAQTRRGGVLLQHGTVLYDADVDLMFDVLKVKDLKIRDKVIKNVKERIIRVRDIVPDATMENVYGALLAGFTDGKRIEFGELTEKERVRAEQLVQEKYGSEEWNARR